MQPRLFVSPGWVLLVVLAFGCTGQSGSDDPGDACERICDEIDDCDPDLTDDEACEDMCDGVERLEDEVTQDCEDALAAIFECASGFSCDVLDTEGREEEDDPHYLDNLFDDCQAEIDEIDQACEGQIDTGDDDDS